MPTPRRHDPHDPLDRFDLDTHDAGDGADPTPANLPPANVDIPRIERAVREILLAVGEDPDREGLLKTPNRVARAYGELMAGLKFDPRSHLKTVFHERYDEVVLLRDIEFHSLCEHHLLPFHGVAHVGYIPAESGKITGLSKLARLVDVYARRPQVQERLTTQIAQTINEVLQPRGVAVVMEALHMCMLMRGVEKQNSKAVTSAMLGAFRDRPETRAEFMELIKSRGGLVI